MTRSIAVGERWPPGISNGLTLPCSRCGTYPVVDYTVTDEEWKRVVRDPEVRLSVLCIECFVSKGGSLDAVTRVQIVGTGQTLVLSPDKLYCY